VAGSDRDLDLAVVAVGTGDAPAIEWDGADGPPESMITPWPPSSSATR